MLRRESGLCCEGPDCCSRQGCFILQGSGLPVGSVGHRDPRDDSELAKAMAL